MTSLQESRDKSAGVTWQVCRSHVTSLQESRDKSAGVT